MPTAAEYETMIGALDWSGLQSLWEVIERRDTSGWEQGKAFEYLVLRAFQFDGAQVRWSYQVKMLDETIEQIDGAVYCAGFSCLVESKDLTGDVDIGPIAKLRNQLMRRPAATVGQMFSRTGFTTPALWLARFVLPQTILLWTGSEVRDALDRRKICDILARKYRACVEDGLSYYNIRESESP